MAAPLATDGSVNILVMVNPALAADGSVDFRVMTGHPFSPQRALTLAADGSADTPVMAGPPISPRRAFPLAADGTDNIPVMADHGLAADNSSGRRLPRPPLSARATCA